MGHRRLMRIETIIIKTTGNEHNADSKKENFE
jgi:hypothetical protein